MGKRLLITLLVVAGFYAVNYVIMEILGLPFYMVIAAYLIIIFACGVVFRAQVFTMAANISARMGSHDRAERLYKKAYFANSKSAVINTNYGITLTREGNGEEAVEVLKKTFDLNPKPLVEKNCYLALGSAYWVKGDLDGAVETFEHMREKYEYVNSTVYTTLGFIYLLKGDYEKAEELTNKALEESPRLSSAWDNLGQIKFRLGNMSGAKEDFLKAVEINPKIVDSLYYLGEIFEAEGDEQSAKDYYKRASELKVIALNTVTQGQIDEKMKKYAEKVL